MIPPQHRILLLLAAVLVLAACYQAEPAGPPAYVPKRHALDLAGRAHEMLEQGDRAYALELLDEAIKADPQFLGAKVDKAMLLADGGDYEEAVGIIENVLAREQASDPNLHLVHGIYLEQLGRQSKARHAYQTAINTYEAQPPDPAKRLRHMLGLARARYLLEGLPAGLRAINAVLEQYPNNKQARAIKHTMVVGKRSAFLVIPVGPRPTADETTATPENRGEE